MDYVLLPLRGPLFPFLLSCVHAMTSNLPLCKSPWQLQLLLMCKIDRRESIFIPILFHFSTYFIFSLGKPESCNKVAPLSHLCIYFLCTYVNNKLAICAWVHTHIRSSAFVSPWYQMYHVKNLEKSVWLEDAFVGY